MHTIHKPATGALAVLLLLLAVQLCSISGKFHIGWSVPQLPASYYIPSSFLHGFFFFVPALVLGGPHRWCWGWQH
jgi:hypothetical protein